MWTAVQVIAAHVSRGVNIAIVAPDPPDSPRGRSGPTLTILSSGNVGADAPGVAGDASSNGPTLTRRPMPRQSKRPFYGWVVVVAVFVILMVASGIGFYNASVILSAATEELNASVGAVSGATGLFFAISGLTGFALAGRMETVDLRWFFVGGGIAGAGALYGLRWVDSVPALYLFFALFGIGFGAGGLVPATTLVTRWFDRRRSIALSVASTGLSVGGIVLTPVAAWLINRDGLADAGAPMAAIWLLGTVPIALLLVRPFPSTMGLRPDGDEAPSADGTTPSPTAEASPTADEPLPGVPYAQARRTRLFIGLCAAYLFIFFGQVGGLAQLYNMVQERTDAATASTSLSALALASVVARLVGGVVVIKVDTRSFTIVVAVVQVVALALLGLAATPLTLIASAVILGVSIGNLLMLQPLLLAEAFGVAEYSRIYSFNQLIGTAGVAAGPFALGLVRDLADYRLAFLVAAVATLSGAVALGIGGPTSAVHRLRPAGLADAT